MPCGEGRKPGGDIGPQRPVPKRAEQGLDVGVGVGGQPQLGVSRGQRPPAVLCERNPLHQVPLGGLVPGVPNVVQALTGDSPAAFVGEPREGGRATSAGVDQRAEQVESDQHLRTLPYPMVFLWAAPSIMAVLQSEPSRLVTDVENVP